MKLYCLLLSTPCFPSACLTFSVPNSQADTLIHLFNVSIANPIFTVISFVQHHRTSLHKWGITAHIAQFVHSQAQSKEHYLLTLAGITWIHLTIPSTESTATGSGTSNSTFNCLSCMTIIYLLPDAQSTVCPRQHTRFQSGRYKLTNRVECLTQDTSQSVGKCKCWAHIAHVVDETEVGKAAGLVSSIVSVVGLRTFRQTW